MSSNNRPSPELSDQVRGNSTAVVGNTAQRSQGESRQRGGADKEKPVEETDVIGDLVGSFGRWQLLMTLLLSLFQVPNTFHIISPVYQSAPKDFWCTPADEYKNLPTSKWIDNYQTPDNCSRLVQISNQTQNQSDSKPQYVDCDAWTYNQNDILGNTWQSEWDLVCRRSYLVSLMETCFLVGVAIGGIVSGYLSDRFGRKRMLIITAILQTIIGLSLFFVKKFEIYITLRFLLGLVSVAVTYSALILAIECVDGKWRTIAGMYNLFPLPISYMIIAGIAFLTQDFRKLQLCIGIPGVFCLLILFVVPESPRWLLEKGRIEDVAKIVQSTAKFNRISLPPNYESLLVAPTQGEQAYNFLWLFKIAYLRRITLCSLCIWFAVNLVYYGIILNMSTFGGNIYYNSALAGLVEVPAIAIAMLIITKVGKKWLFFSTLIGGAIACGCAASAAAFTGKLWLKITFLMMGKFTISAGNTAMPVYTAELYPTVIRNAGVGACNFSAGIALILTPYLSQFNTSGDYVMLIILSCWSFFGALMVLFLPENTRKSSEALK